MGNQQYKGVSRQRRRCRMAKDLRMLDLDAIVSEASQLTVADRLQLIDRLAASVPDDQPPSLSEQWIAEIGRRSREIDHGAVTTESWDSVRGRLFHKYGVEGAS
jgi:putative addiction module component (TIGR02574 family)